ncbi:MAG: N-acetylmuramoyl-L-alanine amidase [Williamsia sp.]|nr:N-acetylmuramoyl-L-alanine amidase [Williamsia sp.]
MPFLLYAVKVVVCSLLLLCYYIFFLRNKQFHQYNRCYLLMSTVLSLVLPLVSVSFSQGPALQDGALVKTLEVISVREWEEGMAIPALKRHAGWTLTLQESLFIIYGTGVVIAGYSLLRSLLYIYKLSRKYPPQVYNQVRFYNTKEPGTPFSFLHAIYWNDAITLTTPEGQDIFQHELYHIRAGHSYDALFMRLINMVCWFNPFFRWYQSELSVIHEYLADRHVSSRANKWDYAELLLTHAINKKTSSVYNPFFHTQIKRRINMLLQQNKTPFSYARKIMALPLPAVLFCAFGLKNGHYPEISNGPIKKASAPITVVIDAAHGGSDDGAHGVDGLLEKDLCLSIARKIKTLAPQYGIGVVMTREQDELPGKASDAREGNRNRVAVLQKSNADLFISVHLNADNSIKSPRSGFDAYISSKNKQYEKSKILASAILGEVKSLYKTTEILKEREQQVYVLSNSNKPSVLIECGFITNDADAAFIKDEKNQENVAHNILKGIVKYQNSLAAGTHGR